MTSSRLVGNGLMALGALLALGALGGGLVNQASRADAEPTEPVVAATSPSPAPTATGVVPRQDPEAMRLGWGPTEDQWQAALADAEALDLEAAAGQVIIAAVSSPDAGKARSLVRRLHLGGVIVMGPAVTSEKRLRALTAAAASPDDGRTWPVHITTDQEGGTVARLGALAPAMPSFMAAGASEPADVDAAFAGVGTTLRQLGFTMDLAPVADVTRGKADPTIRTRSAGSRPSAVAEAVVAASDGLERAGVVPVIKHFPGHGSVTTDSHDSVPVQKASLAKLKKRDFVPFAEAIDAGAPAVMMGHIAVRAWSGKPATMDPRAYAYLREELGFTGAIMTDAMNMGAVTQVSSETTASVRALKAGADIILLPSKPRATRDAIVKAVRKGTLDRERLTEAAARSILLARHGESLAAAAIDSPNVSLDYSTGAAVVASTRCSRVIGDEVQIAGGTSAQRKALARELRKLGVSVGKEGTRIVLVQSDTRGAKGDVIVALAGPWALGKSTGRTFIAAWGTTSTQLRAAARVMKDPTLGSATWPVNAGVRAPLCAA